MIYPNYVKQSPVLGLTSGAAGGAGLSYFTHSASSGSAVDYSTGSVSFDGIDDCLTVADNADFEFGSGNFTLEAFINYTGNPGTGNSTYTIFSKWDNVNSNKGFILRISDDGGGVNLQFFHTTDGSSNNITTGSTVLSPGTWYHIAFVRNGSTGTFYINGVADSTTHSMGSDSIRDTTVPFRIGANLDGSAVSQEFNGLISNVRVIKGTPLYTSNFTTPTSSLTAITNTKLLCCKSKASVTDAVVTPGSITNNNGATVSSSSPPFSTAPPDNSGSVYFYNNSLQLTSTADLCPGTSDFTFECWLRPNNWSGSWMTVYMNGVYDGFYVGKDSSGNFVVRASSNTSFITQSTLPSVNQWTHIAVTRQGSTLRLFYNGVLKNSASNSHNFPTAATSIAQTTSGGEGIDGNISNLRFIKGTALYTSNFTAPTSALTDVTNTKLLCCQTAGPVTAAAVTPSVITTNGNPQSSTSSPFSPSGPSGPGGSVQFDGTDDHLNITGQSDLAFGSGDFTLEFWAYFSSSDGVLDTVMETRSQTSLSDGFLIGRFHTSGYENKIVLYTGGYRIASNSAVSDNTWVHVAVVRSGSTTKMYIDGVAQSTTYSDGNNYSNDDLIIGENANNTYHLHGLISNFRMVKGTAVYTSNFTVPTSLLSEVTNTKLLCCQSTTSATSSTITPGTIVNNGGATVSTSNPFNRGSVSFDGNNDYLSITDSNDFNLGSGNFTMEAWVYANSFGSWDGIIGQWPQNGGHTDNSFVFELVNGSLQFYYVVGSTYYGPINGGSLSTGRWHHVAAVRSGNTMYMFKDGVMHGGSGQSVTHTFNNPTSNVTIGGNIASAGYLNGKISNLRLVKGTALYTSNFTPSTSPLTAVTNTKLLCCQSAISPSSAAVSPGTILNYGSTADSSVPFVTLPSSAVFYASGQDFTDIGPNSYTITKVGNGLTSGNSTSKSGGGSFRFDGSDAQQYFYAGSNTFLDDSLSSWQFQCWARYDSGNAGNVSGDMGMLVDQYVSGVSGRLLFGFQANSLVMRVNGGTVELTSGTILSDNTWYHVLLNWDGTTHRLFTDGILRDSSTTVPAVYTGKRTEFGGGGDLGGYNLHGYMEHVLVENGGTVKTSNFTPNNIGFVT